MAYKKLVRDKIPEIITQNGETPITRILNDIEYKEELIKKLNEECNEVINSDTKDGTLEECADVLEVLIALINMNGYTLDDLINIRNQKFNKRGGFLKKIYLEDVKKDTN